MAHPEDFYERARKLAGEEIDARQWGWWYLSFADRHVFFGAVYIQAYGPVTALRRVHALNIFPGGQVWSIALPPDMKPPPPAFCNRLLSKEELLELDPDAKTLGEWKRGR